MECCSGVPATGRAYCVGCAVPVELEGAAFKTETGRVYIRMPCVVYQFGRHSAGSKIFSQSSSTCVPLSVMAKRGP